MTLIGREIKGYRIKQLIGEGGFGAVYLAEQPIVGRTVAIKVIWPELANNIDFVRRFETEAKIIASLEHPRIVPLYDFWRDVDGAYMVMRLLRHGNLRSKMDKRWEPEHVVRLLNQLASALMLAHRYGVVHRDIKPENILLDEDNNAYLSDFGIAQMFGKKEQDAEIIGGVGSIMYAAPEQIEDSGSSPQTDQYSMAILVYELLTGEHPFKDLLPLPHSKIYEQRLTKVLPKITLVRPDLPPGLNAILERATSLRERDRYEDIMTFARTFRDVYTFKASQRAESSLLNDDTLFRTPDGTIRTSDGSPYIDHILDVVPEEIQNPYRGLRAFQESDSIYFFGREQLTQHIITRLAETDPAGIVHFLAVVGPSGSGKSSLVKAGIIPSLRDDAIPGSKDWFVISMTPGTHPLDELEVALLQLATDADLNIDEQLHRDTRGLARVVKLLLSNTDGDLVLYIDQFEELFTLVEDKRQTEFFLDSLYHAIMAPHGNLRVIVTLRADFYDRPLLYEKFSQLMRERTEVVVPMTSEELDRAIVTPAQLVGVNFEQGLAPTIVSEVSGQLGALPLLQYGLTEIFDERTDNVITLEKYRSIGGILGALARRAEAIYEELTPDQQEAARQLFVRLVNLGEGTEDTRRRVLLQEIQSAASDVSTMQAVIEKFSKSRLLTFDHDPATRSPTIEVAHEAIIREWTRYRGWLDESREDIRLQRNLGTLANEWNKASQDESYLLRGIRLEQYQQWHGDAKIALTDVEQAYLDASIQARSSRQASEMAQERRQVALERRARMRLRFLLVVMTLAVIVTFALFLRVQNENQQVIDARATSDANASISNTLAIVANARAALAQDNIDNALALAVVANTQPDIPVEAQSLLAEVGLGPGVRWLEDRHDSRISRIIVTDDGETFFTADADGIILRWDLASASPIQQYEGHRADIRDIDLNADGSILASGAENGEVVIWDTQSGEIIHQVSVSEQIVRSLIFSNDGRYLVVGGGNGQEDGELAIIDVDSAEVIDRFNSPVGDIFTIAAYNDGLSYLIGGSDSRIALWNMADDTVTTTFSGHTGIVRRVVFNQDYSLMLSGAEDNRVILWDAETGESIQSFQGHSRTVHDVDFGPRDLIIMSTSADSTINVWNTRTGEVIERFRASDNYAFGSIFIPDQMALLSAYIDGTVRRWDLTSVEQVWGRFITQDRGLVRIKLFPENGRVFTSLGPTNLDSIINTRPELVELDPSSGEVLGTFSGHGLAISDVALLNDDTLLTSSFDGTIIRWDLQSGEQIQQTTLNSGFLMSLALPSDQRTVAVASFGELVHILDMSSGETIRTLVGHERPVIDIAYHPNDLWLASGDDRGEIRLWDVETGQTMRIYEGHTGIVFGIVFSPDGEQMLTGSLDGQVILWDVETGQVIRTFTGNSAGVTDIALHPSGEFVMSGAEDGRLLMWFVETGEIVRTFTGHVDAVTGVTFGQDGQHAFSVGLDGGVFQWNVLGAIEGSVLLDTIQNSRHIVELNCEERVQYRLESTC